LSRSPHRNVSRPAANDRHTDCLKTKGEDVDDQGVIAGGKRIPSATVLWTAGVAPSPIVKMLGAETDRAGRISVGPFMNVPDAPGSKARVYGRFRPKQTSGAVQFNRKRL
jgi:hypothetical protein